MVGHRVDIEGTDVFELVAFADECRGVACEAGGITGDVDHAGCAGRGNLAADLGTSTGTRRIKHYDIRLGQMRRHMVQRA